MRWLLNRFGKQKETLLYKQTDRWIRWPKHITAPTQWDMRCIDACVFLDGDSIHLSTSLQVIWHADYIEYREGVQELCFNRLLFKDGTEWKQWPHLSLK